MSEIIRTAESEQAVPCPCGKGKIVHRKIRVFHPGSTWGTYDDEYTVDCDACKAKGCIIVYDRESRARFLVQKLMKIEI